ncbi:hypothetical protein BOTBODRAFT_179892 [Botryobasidium botryosum FD-172 SS1]|uniref:FAD-binding domain-containing protein n=1 Tax=Botryobasidium botryosum (strain FD-172 SS1) TaxID=930990 RepID=A0A067M142_BOTB1|nr:hypothetical protein BOTBODRAFT_179892 [Botryobasidium botryosum FD-172 SS1]
MDTSKSSANSIAVLIVGAGPAGLTAALALAKNNVPIRIIEKNPVFEARARGAGLYPRTLEVLANLGAIGPIIENGQFVNTMRAYGPNGRDVVKSWEFIEFVGDVKPDIPYPNLLWYPQEGTEVALRDALEEYGVHVELSTEFIRLEQDATGVTAHIVSHGTHETVKVDWVIGADGGKSVVRKGLDSVSFLGETREESTTIVADVHVENFDRGAWHLWSNPEAGRIIMCPVYPSPRFVCFLMREEGEVPKEILSGNLDALQIMFNSAAGRDDIKMSKLNCISTWRPNIRMVDKFSVGRVFLVGDAAHTHPLTGGQGLNTSVQDAHNLSWKIALVYKKLAPPSLLSTYSEERMPLIAEMLNLTKELYTSLYGKPGSASTPLADLDTQVWQRGGKLSGLGVNCRWSSIVIDERTVRAEGETIEAYGLPGGVLRAGDRAPDAPSLTDIADADKPATTLFKLFGPAHHTALVFPAADSDFKPNIIDDLNSFNSFVPLVVPVLILPAGSYPSQIKAEASYRIVEDKDGYARKGYDISGGAWVVIVRPDGVVGAIVKGREGAQKYFSSIFLALR